MRTDVQDIVYILALFAFVCVCICVYNVYVLFNRWTANRKNRKVCAEIERILERSLRAMSMGMKAVPADVARLNRMLRDGGTLIQFNNVFVRMRSDGVPGIEQIPVLFMDTFNQLAAHYRSRSPMEQIYLAYTYSILGVQSPPLVSFLMESLRSRNLYLQIQSLKTLSVFGATQPIVEAITILGQGDMLFSNKLIADVLSGFRGDVEKMSRALFARIESLPTSIQVAFINSLQTRKDATLAPELAGYMQNPRLNLEVQIALLKYFRDVYCPDAVEPILAMAQDGPWERVAIAAKALRNYPGMRSMAQVKGLLGDRNWFVRLNSATTLVAIAPAPSYYDDILQGDDAFARDILVYAIEQARLDGDGGVLVAREAT